jgi:hypothetical protein
MKTPSQTSSTQGNHTRTMKLAALAATAFSAAIGCGAGEMSGADEGGPVILATSTQQLRVGDSLEFFGGNFAFSKEQYTSLHFKGVFTGDSGQTPVDLKVRPHWADGNRLVWAQVGPYSNPFSKDDQLGVFEGDVRAVNVSATGTQSQSEPYRLRLAFTESIVIRTLQPVMATCGEPVKRLLGGFPYKVKVEAVGFTPVNFTFAIGGEASRDRGRVYRMKADGNTASFGDKGELVFDTVPDDVAFQLITFAVSALGTDGIERSNALVFAVHRPIEYVDSGTYKVAEVMAPMPDSGCMAGGSNGRSATYTESHTDTRSRTVGINWSDAWNQSTTGTATLSHSVGQGINVTRNGSATSTNTIGWTVEDSSSWTGGLNAGATLFGVINVGGSIEHGIEHKTGQNGSHSEAYQQGWAVGRDYTTNDTESWAFAKTEGYTVTKGGQDFWTVSSSDSKSLAFTGQIMPGEFGVFFRQTVRVAIPGSLVAYNLCGEPTVVGKTNFFDYNWSVDLATGPSCTPYPTPSLPEAQCFVTPCSNQ